MWLLRGQRIYIWSENFGYAIRRRIWGQTEKLQPELKFTNKEAQSAIKIVCRYIESRTGIACETFKAVPYLDTVTELEKHVVSCIR